MAAPIIKIKRSSVPGKIPTTASLPVGEFGINTNDGKVYIQQDSVGIGSTVIVVNPWSVGLGSNTYNTFFTSGSVGIGTTIPTSSLHVVGNTLVTGITTTSSLRGYSSLVGTASSATTFFTVTVASKTSNHRYFGTGSGSAYYIDGIESPFLTLLPGKTYRFTQDDASNSTHQLLFYYTADKTTQYTTNVTTNGTAGSAGSYTQILVTDTTPVVLHYQCINHEYMGNAAQFSSNVVDTPYQITARSGINVTGVVTATTFVGALTGTATTANNVSSSININTSGIITATSFSGSGTNLTGIVTSIVAGTNVTISGSTGQVTINASGGGGSSQFVETSIGIHTLSNVGIGTTNPTSALTVTGDAKIIGVVTATSFSGSGSGLTNIPSGQLTGALPALDGSALTGVVGSGSGVVIKDSGSLVGTAGTIDFGANLSVSAISAGIVTVTGSGGGGFVEAVGISKTTSTYISTEGQTIFNATYNVGYVDVYLNGSKLSQSQYTSTNGSSIILNQGASVDDVMEIVGFGGIIGVGIATAGGIVGTAVTLFDFRGPGISTVTVSSGIGTINITGGTSSSSGSGTIVNELDVMLFG
jgi:hypothetical protein